ncbi:hypothetical protein D8852_07310 [Streptococcus mitis]|uniref:Uncharacterized protein n=1 Tax=Streptococcus mitis TaxID=28037 RepID=A0A428EC97_STRMT|nr:hypothetical protein [Streptococcus mitis]RSI79997.1 hypothetical protein D8852_07310 [Streptococcus mitis]RSJ07689.1 hypothetical protein D8839_05895 [Streptococcus mitis]DAN37099.1 MAG TPA: hypothetical protein [Caudoviricetes sp.]
MTKETKNTVLAETIVENLKEFVEALHYASKKAMFYSLLEKNVSEFKTSNVIHNISHDLLDILDGKSAKEVLEEADENEDDSSLVGSIAINVETGKVEGIDDIKDTKVKEQILAAVSKVVEELGGN